MGLRESPPLLRSPASPEIPYHPPRLPPGGTTTPPPWLLHETAVAWTRHQLKLTSPKKAWKETREAFAERLREVCRRINGDYGVEGLCREFPMRIQMLIDNGGDNISK